MLVAPISLYDSPPVTMVNPPPTILLIQAPAKLNLALSVGAPQSTLSATVMHPLASWMVTVDLFDDLYLEQLAPDSFSLFATIWHKDALRRSEIDWSLSKDLAHRAHDALENFVGRALPVKSRLEKRIPIGGGLGGGSSDAAAMLRGLNELFALGVAQGELETIAAQIGSDVPFLIRGGSAIVSGFGEVIEPLGDPPALHAVLFFPNVPCPTSAVYGRFDELAARDDAHPDVRGDLVRALAAQRAIASCDPFNDLAESARQIAPAMADDMEEIAALADQPVHVCGSGSSLFVICPDSMHAAALAAAAKHRLDLAATAVTVAATPKPRRHSIL